MKEGSSLFLTKKGTLIGLACAAAFAAPQAMAITGLPLSGQGLTLSGSLSAGLSYVKASDSTIGGAGDTSGRYNVWSGDSSIFLNGSTKLDGSFFTGVGFQVGIGIAPDDGSVSASSGTIAGTDNTGLGVRTTIGDVFFGIWDTPYKVAGGQNTVTGSANGPGGSAAGILSTPGFGVGSCTNCLNGYESGVKNITGVAAGTSTSINGAMSFRRRQGNSVAYYTPSFSGFQAILGASVNEEKTVGAAPTGATSPHLYGATVAYENGPLKAAVGSEWHRDYLWGAQLTTGLTLPFGRGLTCNGVANCTAGIGRTSSDKAYVATVGYTFGNTTIAAVANKLMYGQSGPAVTIGNLEAKQFYLGVAQNLGGPHRLYAYVIKLDDLTCNPAPSCPGDTGGKAITIAYRYMLTRDASLNVSAAKMENDSHASYKPSGSAPTVGGGTGGRAGLDFTHFGVGVAQRF